MPWWREAVFYQIYPRSFADADGDGVGDLRGITAHLDHLRGSAHSLGVDAIWLSPFYPSPMADFGYDVADYCDVDPVFGSLGDFDELVAEAHARGIRVVVDFVPNHTSSAHPWFSRSRSSRDGPYRDWYVWADPAADGGPPNNWLSNFPDSGPAWTFDPATGQHYLHSYLAEQPDLNWWNPRVRAAMGDVLRFWMDRGVDGFRIDAAHRLVKDPQLRDNPPEAAGLRRDILTTGRYVRHIDHPEVHRVLREVRGVLDSYGERVAIGEVGLWDLARMLAYYGDGDELHLAFNFAFWDQPWAAERFRHAVDAVEAELPTHAWAAYALSNHDISRAATRYGGDGEGQQRARLAAMMLLTLRGTPFLYYGEEIGMTDVAVPPAERHDPDGRDPERSPMQWAPGPQAGFSAGRPWLPVPESARTVNVEAQRDDPASLLSLYRALIRLRRAHPALRAGGHRSVDGAPAGLYAYERRHGDERFLIGLNFTGQAVPLSAPRLPVDGVLRLSTDPSRAEGSAELGGLRLAPYEGVAVQLS